MKASAVYDGGSFTAAFEVHRKQFENNYLKQLQSLSFKRAPAGLKEAVLYSLEAGGKRFRPALVYEASRLNDLEQTFADRIAVAVECLHTYSLIHDDLPAMDNDDLRRGKPSNHKRFNEATAILAGDTLHSLAFELLLGVPDSAIMARYFARASGLGGMISGQYLDMFHGAESQLIEKISRLKTGKLIEACIVMPFIYKRAGKSVLFAVSRWALQMGKLFQLTDDILDITGTSTQLGKTPGKDEAQNKLNLVNVAGLPSAQEAVAKLTAQLSAKAMRIFPRSDFFQQLPAFLQHRIN